MRDKSDFSVKEVIFEYFNGKIYGCLVEMIEDEEVCAKVFEIMEEVSVKDNDVKLIIDKLCKTIESKKKKSDNKVSVQ